MKRKILVTTSTFPKNARDASSARFVSDLAAALSEHYDVHVLAPHSYGALRVETVREVKVHRFRYFFPERLQKLTEGAGIMSNLSRNGILNLQLPLLFISETYNAVRIVKRERIDIINSHWIVPQGLAAAFLKKLLGVKHVMTVHGADTFVLKRWGALGKTIARYAVNRADVVMPVSSYLKETLDGLVNKEYRCNVVPMGFAVDRFNGAKSAAPISKEKKVLKLLFVGKLVEKKGLKYLLEALNILKKKGSSPDLVVAGSGPLEKELKCYVSEKGLDAQVSFKGWTPASELSALYGSSDITVVPSVFDRRGETEGMPVVVLESLAMGTPVLASRISGIPDIVEDGENGWLVKHASSEALAEKIAELSKMGLSRFSRSALDTASKYTYEKIASRYKEVMEDLV